MEADPDELLVWLKGDGGVERDLQISALEQLCKFIIFNLFKIIVQYEKCIIFIDEILMKSFFFFFF